MLPSRMSPGLPGLSWLPRVSRVTWSLPEFPGQPQASTASPGFLGLPASLLASQDVPGPIRDSSSFPGPSRASPDLRGPPWASPGLAGLIWALPGLSGLPRASSGFPAPPRSFPGLPAGPSWGSPGLPYRLASPVPPIQWRRGGVGVGRARQVQSERIHIETTLRRDLPPPPHLPDDFLTETTTFTACWPSGPPANERLPLSLSPFEFPRPFVTFVGCFFLYAAAGKC